MPLLNLRTHFCSRCSQFLYKLLNRTNKTRVTFSSSIISKIWQLSKQWDKMHKIWDKVDNLVWWDSNKHSKCKGLVQYHSNLQELDNRHSNSSNRAPILNVSVSLYLIFQNRSLTLDNLTLISQGNFQFMPYYLILNSSLYRYGNI